MQRFDSLIWRIHDIPFLRKKVFFSRAPIYRVIDSGACQMPLLSLPNSLKYTVHRRLTVLERDLECDQKPSTYCCTGRRGGFRLAPFTGAADVALRRVSTDGRAKVLRPELSSVARAHVHHQLQTGEDGLVGGGAQDGPVYVGHVSPLTCSRIWAPAAVARRVSGK